MFPGAGQPQIKISSHVLTMRKVGQHAAANIIYYRAAQYFHNTQELSQVCRVDNAVAYFEALRGLSIGGELVERWRQAAVTLDQDCRWLEVTASKPKSLLPIDVEAAASRLDKSEATIKRWCKQQKRPCHRAYKASGKWLIPVEDIPHSSDG